MTFRLPLRSVQHETLARRRVFRPVNSVPVWRIFTAFGHILKDNRPSNIDSRFRRLVSCGIITGEMAALDIGRPRPPGSPLHDPHNMVGKGLDVPKKQ